MAFARAIMQTRSYCNPSNWKRVFGADTQAGLAEELTAETERQQTVKAAAKPWRVNSKS